MVEVSSGLCRVALAGRTLLCVIRSSLRVPHSGFSNVVAAGDEVLVSHNGHERGMVEAVLPRRSALARPDVFYDHLQQVIVANVDQVLIVAAWREPAFWPELVDRYLIAAVRHNLASVICINKTDLADDPAELTATAAAYEAAGCRVICTSALTGQGLDALADLLSGRTTALAGLSGVGKSSLLSAVEPGLQLRISEVSDRQTRGPAHHDAGHAAPAGGGRLRGRHPRHPGVRPLRAARARTGALLPGDLRGGRRMRVRKLLAHTRAGLRGQGRRAGRPHLANAVR